MQQPRKEMWCTYKQGKRKEEYENFIARVLQSWWDHDWAAASSLGLWPSDRTSAVGKTAKELSWLGRLLCDEKLDRFNLFRWLIHIFFSLRMCRLKRLLLPVAGCCSLTNFNKLVHWQRSAVETDFTCPGSFSLKWLKGACFTVLQQAVKKAVASGWGMVMSRMETGPFLLGMRQVKESPFLISLELRQV